MNYLVTEILIKETMLKAKLKEKELIYGGTEMYMMVNGRLDKSKDMVCGKVFMETAILDSGLTVRLKGMEFTRGLTVIDMKVNGKSALDMVTVQISSQIMMSTQVNTEMVDQKDMDSISGPTETNTLENLKKAKNMEKVNGESNPQT